MTSERMEWVEIFEPSSRNIMYANLTTGKCVWDPPPNVPVKKFDDNQWWELYDANTSRFYYYNATTQKTVWHKPQNCDIIPLAKLQQIKQNTEVSDGNEDNSSISESTNALNPSRGNGQHSCHIPVASGARVSSQHARNSSLPNNHLNHYRSPPDSYSQSRVYRGSPRGRPSLHDPWSLQKPDGRPFRGLQRSMTSSMTQTSPAPSPRISRRASHHHYHPIQDGTKTNTSSSSGSHQHRHGALCRHQSRLHEANGETQHSQNSGRRRVRRSSQSSQSSCVSCSQPFVRESGRLSDSSLSQSRTSIESSAAKMAESPSSYGLRDSQRSRARSSCSRTTRNTASITSPSHLPSPSTPSSQRRTPHDQFSHMSKQKSFDVANFNPKRPELSIERPREIALSRSYSFMSRPKCYDEEGMHERFVTGGMRSVESTPQPRRRQRMHDLITSSPDSSLASHCGVICSRQRSDSSGLDSLATPMTNRKQRSFETTNSKPSEMKLSTSAHTRLAASVPSDSSASPPSPRHGTALFSPFNFESTHCPGSAASTLTDKENRSQYGRGSPDSSPHSQFDSGLVSGTTGSRGSADSSMKRAPSSQHGPFIDKGSHICQISSNGVAEKEPRKCAHNKRHHCSKHRPSQMANAVQATTDSDRSDTLHSSSSSMQMVQSTNASQNHNSSSASSTTAKQPSPKNGSKQDCSSNSSSPYTQKQPSPVIILDKKVRPNIQHRDMTHLYSNLDYVTDQPVYQFIMEQAKLSGYRFMDPMRDEADSLHSDDSGRRNDDSDEFADDEGMSNAESSSQEYLADDETYTQFFMPSYMKNNHSEPDTREPPMTQEVPTRDHPQVTTCYLPLVNIPDIPEDVSVVQMRKGGPQTPSHEYPEPSYYSNVPVEPQFSSLRRKKDPAPFPPDCSPIQGKSELPISFSNMKKPLSETDFERLSLTGEPQPPGSNLMEKYARENLNVHTRGLLRKKVPVMDMISWTKEAIRKPMLVTIDKSLKSQACELFKLVQIYMSDRRPKPDMTLNSVGLDIVSSVYNKAELRDELYVQVCRQTTENQKRDSLRRGWELMAICLEFFPPSDKFIPYLSGYIAKHCDSTYQTMYPEISKWPIHIQINHYAGVCSKRLERTAVNGKRQRLKKPTLEEIDLARLHIFRASMFGGTLDEVMALQRDRYPHRRLPWVQTTLSEEVLRLQGTSTEGIFRVPADVDEVNQLKQVVDHWEVGDCGDSHVMAALLKLWYRELYQPLIPDSLYSAAVEASENPPKAMALVNQLPDINRLVLAYLIRFLQYFSQPEIVSSTKMDASNLAMVMAPNCLRCTSNDPKIIYENTRKEMAFMRTLIQNLDTTFIEGIV